MMYILSMKIVFLDESTLHTGELDLSVIKKLGTLICFPTTSPEQALAHCADADIVLTNKALIQRETLSQLPNLKMIQSVATGVNQIDLDAATEHGVTVCNVAGYSTEGVAQHVFTMMLNLSTNIHQLNNEIDTWPTSPIFTRLTYPISDLHGKILGVVGMGSIGKAVTRIAQAFGMQVQALQREGASQLDNPSVKRVCADTFFSTSDFISLHCPLNTETQGMINKTTLKKMKRSAILINTGRGPLIVEENLYDALINEEIAGAGLDVLSQEPPAHDNPLISYDKPNLVITPHTAWAGIESRKRLLAGIVENITAFQAGSPLNVIA